MCLLFIIVAALGLGGCFTSHVRTEAVLADGVNFDRDADAAPTFRYGEPEIDSTNHLEGRGNDSQYQLRLVTLPSIGDNGQEGLLVRARYFRSIRPGPHPLVVVLPIWGTYTYPSRKISSFIQRHSHGEVHVLYVQGERYFVDWEALHAAADEATFLAVWREAVEHERVTMIDIRRLVDWAELQPEVAADRIGLIGFSFGAVVAGTVVTQEPRLAAAVLVMGGAHQHKILAHCRGKKTDAVRTKVAASFGWTADDYDALLEPIMRPVDPATYPDRVDPRRVLIIDAGRDDCVPQESRTALWETLGRPERISMNYGHKKAFFSITPIGLNWMRFRIWEFFEARLLEPGATRD